MKRVVNLTLVLVASIELGSCANTSFGYLLELLRQEATIKAEILNYWQSDTTVAIHITATFQTAAKGGLALSPAAVAMFDGRLIAADNGRNLVGEWVAGGGTTASFVPSALDSMHFRFPAAIQVRAIRLRGHLPKGGYDVDHGGQEAEADPAQLH